MSFSCLRRSCKTKIWKYADVLTFFILKNKQIFNYIHFQPIFLMKINHSNRFNRIGVRIKFIRVAFKVNLVSHCYSECYINNRLVNCVSEYLQVSYFIYSLRHEDALSSMVTTQRLKKHIVAIVTHLMVCGHKVNITGALIMFILPKLHCVRQKQTSIRYLIQNYVFIINWHWSTNILHLLIFNRMAGVRWRKMFF